MSSYYHNHLQKAIFWLIIATLIFYLLPVKAKVPNDQRYSWQESMWNQINAPKAWDFATGSKRAVVAIIDIGVDINHEDLANNIWINKDEIANNGIDDDNNGYTDDVNGWNFVENNNQVLVPNISEIEDPDIVSHGTMAAGLIGALGDNDKWGVGVNWSVRIMPLRAINNNGSGHFKTVATAVNYAVDNGADVINLSVVGKTDDKGLRESLERAYSKGVVIVTAAGNDGRSGENEANLSIKQRYPICFDYAENINWLLGVTAVNANDRLSNFANYGSCVDLAAPGENINSTLYYQSENYYNDKFGGDLQGTSFSVPLVAGAASLVKSAHPSWSAKEIISSLLFTSDNIDDKNISFVNKIGQGRLNIARAVEDAYLRPVSAETIKTGYTFLNADSTGEVIFYDFSSSTTSGELIARLYNTKIIDLLAADINDDNNIELVLLIKRGNYYYVRILRPDGALWREFPLLSNQNESLVYNKVKVFWDTNNIGSLVVESQNKNNSKIKLVNYEINGQKSKELELNKPLLWTTDKDGNLIISSLNKGNLTIKSLNWEGKELNIWRLDKVDKIYDLQTGRIWGGERDEVIFLAIQGSEVKMVVVDLVSSSWFDKQIGKKVANENWHLIVGPYGEVVFPYNNQDSNQVIYSGKGLYLKEITLPKLDKHVWLVGAREL